MVGFRAFSLLLLLTLTAAELLAQRGSAPSDGAAPSWNSARVLELVQRAQALRAETQVDTALVSYRSDARGYVYFYLDREDTGERNLIKTDQVALEVYWRAPDLVRQRIVGWRDEKRLPTNIHYHIDHLAVVHDNFGDLIRIGDGDEVRDVLHPAAPGAEAFYEYRLIDSLTLRLPGLDEPVRVYELDVRPRDLAEPGLLGALFVDRRSGALVRMDFTFTPSAYVDRNLDYINISLDNGLWLGRFWLPNRQRVEIRRQIPELDIPAGSVIRGSMRVGNYRFNEPLPYGLFVGPQVTVAPREEREAFEFEEPLYAELRAEGIGPGSELREIRRQALALARQRRLSGMPGTRLLLGAASDVVRYNRAEGAVVGLGVARSLGGTTAARLHAGWAFGPQHAVVRTGVGGRSGNLGWTAAGYLNEPREVGGVSVASGVINTFSTLLGGRDYQDLYYARGAEVALSWPLSPEWSLRTGVHLERHGSAERAVDFSVFGGETLRAVREVDAGDAFGASLTLGRSAPAEARRWWAGDWRVEGGRVSTAADPGPGGGAAQPDLNYARLGASVAAGQRWDPAETALEVELTAGHAWGRLPRQELFLLGGRGSVPGYPFRAFGGDRAAHAGATLSVDLSPPWLRGRLRAAAGWADVAAAAARAAPLWGAQPTDGVITSVGGGVGLLFDVIRVDLMRGLNRGGRWELIVETRPAFWDFL